MLQIKRQTLRNQKIAAGMSVFIVGMVGSISILHALNVPEVRPESTPVSSKEIKTTSPKKDENPIEAPITPAKSNDVTNPSEATSNDAPYQPSPQSFDAPASKPVAPQPQQQQPRPQQPAPAPIPEPTLDPVPAPVTPLPDITEPTPPAVVEPTAP